MLGKGDGTVRFLHGIASGLPAPQAGCGFGTWNGGGQLQNVTQGISATYGRSSSCGLGDNQKLQTPAMRELSCTTPGGFCSPDGIYVHLAPDDHTGDVLGYWATEPDHDHSVTALGVKPLNSVGLLGGGVRVLSDGVKLTEGALAIALVPIICLANWLIGSEDDCTEFSKDLADALVPIEEIASIVPVIGAERSGTYATMWHFINMGPVSNDCSDRQGLMYEEAGPNLQPGAVDYLIMAGSDLVGLTLNYSESAGAKRFDIQSENDGHPANCERGRSDWEWDTIGHTEFLPLDNLGHYGWNTFAESDVRIAKDLGWAFHALGDAVAPHHVVGTSAWGHRPYEDAVESEWPEIIYAKPAGLTGIAFPDRRAQYEQLRRILGNAFKYYQKIQEWRADLSGFRSNALPLRPLITELAQETYDQVMEGGVHHWPLLESVTKDGSTGFPSIEYQFGSTGAAIDFYTDEPDADDRMRGHLERGTGAMLASMIAMSSLGSSQEPGGDSCGANGVFASCGMDACQGGCCVRETQGCETACSVGCPFAHRCENGCCVAEPR